MKDIQKDVKDFYNEISSEDESVYIRSEENKKYSFAPYENYDYYQKYFTHDEAP